MSDAMDPFDPAAWHERGVLRVSKLKPKRTVAQRARNAVAAASVALTISAVWVMPADGFVLDLNFTSASRPPGTMVVSQDDTGSSGDRIDRSEWGRLITLFDRLPRDERVAADDDPEPFV